MSVVGYRRVSTKDQRLDRQDLGSVDRMFEEKVSGKDRDRPELAACMAYLRDGDTLRCHSVDRLGRSLLDLLAIVDELTSRGVAVEFAKEGMTFDPSASDPYAKLQLSMLSSFAEFERSIARSRQEEGIVLAKERGAYKGRQPALSPEDVRVARQRRTDGVSLARLVRDYGVAKSTMVAALAGNGPYGQGEYAA
jgi:DNA invertase Pin-like site-specific DNA recombinase